VLRCAFEAVWLALSWPKPLGEVFNLPIGRCGETGEHVAQVGVRVDASPAAALDDGINDRAAIAGVCFAVSVNWGTSMQMGHRCQMLEPYDVYDRRSEGAFANGDPGMTRKLCGLGLGFFRHRLAEGPFRWPEPGQLRYERPQLEEVARAVVG
jgi:hypothetical protein